MHWQMKDTSRARRVVENAFGILANQWRLYYHHIYLNPDNVTTVVKATVVLHNILTLPNNAVHTDVVDNRAEIHDDAFQDLARQGNWPATAANVKLLATLTVIMVLLNGKMIVHKIGFKRGEPKLIFLKSMKTIKQCWLNMQEHSWVHGPVWKDRKVTRVAYLQPTHFCFYLVTPLLFLARLQKSLYINFSIKVKILHLQSPLGDY